MKNKLLEKIWNNKEDKIWDRLCLISGKEGKGMSYGAMRGFENLNENLKWEEDIKEIKYNQKLILVILSLIALWLWLMTIFG